MKTTFATTLRSLSLFCLLLITALACNVGAVESDTLVHLEPVPEETALDLPTETLGSFMGVVDGVLIVAGGTSAPGVSPADTAPVAAIHYRERTSTNWLSAALPLPVAHGATVVDDSTMYCIGGMTPDGCTDQVLSIRVRRDDDSLVLDLTSLPPLPSPRAFSGAAVMDGTLYVVGGIPAPGTAPLGELASLVLPKPPPAIAQKGFMEKARDVYRAVGRIFIPSLRETADENQTQAMAAWETEPLGGKTDTPGRLMPALGVRRDEIAIANALFILGGWEAAQAGPDASAGLVPATGCLKFIPRDEPRGEWNETKAGWHEVAPLEPGMVLIDTLEVGPAHLLALGFRVDPDAPARPLDAALATRTTTLCRSYHVFTDTWVELPGLPASIGAAAIPGAEDVLLVERDNKSGAARLVSHALKARTSTFSWLDYAMVVLYIGSLVWIGSYFSKREKGTEDFFLGGRKIPWWAAGLSIYATGVSAISFMAIPAKTYTTNWLYICMGIFPIFSTYIAAYLFVPMLRRLNLTAMTEYSQLRFDRVIRTISAVLSVFGQVGGRMAITLLLPSLALSAVTGWNVSMCVIGMGILATIYTVMGGIGAVIWTDVIQVIVLFGGAILSLVIVLLGVDGGLLGTIEIGQQFGKFQAFDWSWDFTVATVWVMAIWGISDIFTRLGQDSMQRTWSTDGIKGARRAMITCALVSIPGTIIFYALGSALFAFYRSHPETLNPTLNNDAIFPLFISQQLPAGIAGIVIAGLFAAAMSTLDSAMNGVATIVTRDWFDWRSSRGHEHPDRTQLRTARWITVACGALGTWMGWYLSKQSFGSLWDTFSIIMSLIGGGFGGTVAVGLLTRRANAKGVLIASIINTFFVIWLKLFTDIHFFMYGTIAVCTGFSMAYLFSILFGGQDRDLTGLTIWTPQKDDPPGTQG